MLIERASWLDAAAARAIADPGQDAERAPSGPLAPIAIERGEEAKAALKLARLAGLLPALWVVDGCEGAAAVDIATFDRATATVTAVARARLPLEGMPETQVAVFRAADGEEHIALVIGAFAGKPPLCGSTASA